MNFIKDDDNRLSIAISDLREAVDRWINEQKNRLMSLEGFDTDVLEDDLNEEIPTTFTTVRTRPLPPSRALSAPTPLPNYGTRRPNLDESTPSHPRVPNTEPTSRERLDALARHLDDRARRSKEQGPDSASLSIGP